MSSAAPARVKRDRRLPGPRPSFDLSKLRGKVFQTAHLTPPGQVSRAGYREIVTYCVKHRLPCPAYPSPSDFEWQLKTLRGSFAKRYGVWARRMAKKWNAAGSPKPGPRSEWRTPDEKDLAALGQIAERFSAKAGERYVFTVVKPEHKTVSIGHPGGSCWADEIYRRSWGDEDDETWTYLTEFRDCGGMAIVFAETPEHLAANQGVGRLWAYQAQPGLFVVFNGYLKKQGSTKRLASLVAEALGGDSERVALYSENDLSINDAYGILIGEPARLREFCETSDLQNDDLPCIDVP